MEVGIVLQVTNDECSCNRGTSASQSASDPKFCQGDSSFTGSLGGALQEQDRKHRQLSARLMALHSEVLI